MVDVESKHLSLPFRHWNEDAAAVFLVRIPGNMRGVLMPHLSMWSVKLLIRMQECVLSVSRVIGEPVSA